jgi:flagellar biosynthesis/type III secretory pathway protein FliH
MTRVLQRPAFGHAPIDVPAPPGWDSVALAAYEQGYELGDRTGREAGRRDLMVIDGHIDRCLTAVAEASRAMTQRVIEVAELLITTTLRHIPEARTAGLLVRIGEVLATFDPGPICLSVHPNDFATASDAIANRPPNGQTLTLANDHTLAPGEFRLSSEWADAEGTFERYIEAAREALEMHLAVDPR